MRARIPPRDEYADTLLQPDTNKTRPATLVIQRMNTKKKEDEDLRRSDRRPDQKTNMRDTPKSGKDRNRKEDLTGNMKNFERSLKTSMKG